MNKPEKRFSDIALFAYEMFLESVQLAFFTAGFFSFLKYLGVIQ